MIGLTSFVNYDLYSSGWTIEKKKRKVLAISFTYIQSRLNVCLPDDKWEWWDARLGWRDELGLSLAFNKRFASSLPPEDVLDSTSLTPLSAGLAGSDPLPVCPRWNRNARVSFGNCVNEGILNAHFCNVLHAYKKTSFPIVSTRFFPKMDFNRK